MSREKLLPWLGLAALCLLFLGAGVLFVPMAGIQYDEVLFINGIYAPEQTEYFVFLRGKMLSAMLMSYLGTLKAMVYHPLVLFVEPGRMVLRLPMLLLATASLILLYLLLRRLAGTKAALAGTLLLATDAVYLLTSVYDWGPVVLQHFFFVAALYAVVVYAQGGRRLWLGIAAFCCGLALWDKALFAWTLGGMGLAALLFYWRGIWTILKDWRAVALMLAGFAAGASPLLYYNWKHDLKTFRSNTVRETRPEVLRSKVTLLDATLDGSGLFTYIVRQHPEGAEIEPQGWKKIPDSISRWLGQPYQSYQPLVFVLAAFAFPLLWWSAHRRIALMFATGLVLIYAQMFFTREAGGGLHHTVLIYPLPQILTALVFAEVARRFSRRGLLAGGALILIAGASNLAVLNHYFVCFTRYGATTNWTPAINSLVAEVSREPGRIIFSADWGIVLQVQYLGKRRIGFHFADTVVGEMASLEARRYLDHAIADPATLFVTHTEGREVNVGVRRKLLDHAAGLGYRDELRKVVSDDHGVPIFEVHQFRK